MPSLGGGGGYGGSDVSGSGGRGSPGGPGDAPGPGGSFNEGRAPSRGRGTQSSGGNNDGAKQAPKPLVFRHIKIDWSAYTVKRGVRQGQRQTDVADIRARGELSGENWGKTFETNYRQIMGRVKDYGLKNLPAEDKLLYEGYQAKQKAGAVRGQTLRSKSSYGSPTEYSQAKEAYARRGSQADRYETLATASLSQWQAKYNVQANVQENIAQSRKRVKYRERFAAMQISRERTQGRKTRATLRRGASGLAVNFGNGAATGLGIPT